MTRGTSSEYTVILLGNHDTGDHADVLVATAAEHHASITEVYTFDPQHAGSQDDLTDIEAVVTALSRAVATTTPVWIPFPTEDFGSDRLRRICLVLQRRGTNLLLGPHLWPCPVKGGVNEIDFALRREVQAVDELDRAVLAAAVFNTLRLDEEIARALAEAGPATVDLQTRPAPPDANDLINELNAAFGPGPELPPANKSWMQRHPGLKSFVTWLVRECGLNQATAAEVINAAGHRTPQGRTWQQPTISALINGRYDRRVA